jgi:AraC-like DNA-binding protein
MQSSFSDIINIGQQCFERFIDSSNAPEISDLDIELAGCSNLSGEYVVGRVTPPNHTLFYSLSGEGCFRTPHGSFSLSSGQLITLPANQSFEVTITSKKWDIIWLNLSDTEQWNGLSKHTPIIVSNINLAALHHAMELLYLEQDNRNREAAIQIIGRHLRHVISQNDQENSDDEGIDRHAVRLQSLFAAVENQLQFQWSVESLSKKAHYSAPHLHRLCLKYFERSPMQQVIYLRMQRARNLLLKTQWPISYIAHYVGYANVFTFSKRFKKSVGKPPREFREASISDKH